MTGNHLVNIKLQNYFLNFCVAISIAMFGIITYSKLVV